jgi:uncharacterized protein
VEGRIEHAFRARLRALAKGAGHADPAGEAERLVGEALAAAAATGASRVRALATAWLRALSRASPRRVAAARPPRFLCDPSLGGLARWLRAAGYEAWLAPPEPSHRLPEEALRRGLVLLTTEAEVLDRRIVADGSLAVVWLPSTLGTALQLRLVCAELGLARREPRCMACGGDLVPTPKEDVLPRIPPRTARWKDEYFVCAGCSRLFWRGTHWERIDAALREAVAA